MIRQPLAVYTLKLRLEFTNGEVGIYDCRPLLKRGVFQELNDIQYFNQVRALLGSVAWPHEQDICPDTLYLDSEKPKKTQPNKPPSKRRR